MTPYIDVYSHTNGDYLHSFEQTTENIANYVANLLPSDNIKLVETLTDNLVLTTMGNFIDYVPDKHWFTLTLSPIILPKQLGSSPIVPITTFDKYAMEDTD